MKAIAFIKQYTMAVIAAIAIIGFSSFKLVENLAAPQSGYYVINTTSSNTADKNLQNIEFREGATAPTGPNCNLTNANLPCRVHLDLTNFVSSDPIEGMTVEEAELAGAVVGTYAKRP